MLNQQLAQAFAEETGAVENIKKPQVIVSLLCTFDRAYAGISLASDNLSDWPGGMRHFAHTPDEVSRAEFKLLEALEVFGLSLPSQGSRARPGSCARRLDAPVTGSRPACRGRRSRQARSALISQSPAWNIYRGYAEKYLEDALKRRRKFDVIANDMRMDAREAARVLAQAAPCLRPDGIIISTLKLPHATEEIDPLKNLNEALSLLGRHYQVVQARQLFHNRQEVTVVAARPVEQARLQPRR